jgi:hypothetical protein
MRTGAHDSLANHVLDHTRVRTKTLLLRIVTLDQQLELGKRSDQPALARAALTGYRRREPEHRLRVPRADIYSRARRHGAVQREVRPEQ